MKRLFEISGSLMLMAISLSAFAQDSAVPTCNLPNSDIFQALAVGTKPLPTPNSAEEGYQKTAGNLDCTKLVDSRTQKEDFHCDMTGQSSPRDAQEIYNALTNVKATPLPTPSTEFGYQKRVCGLQCDAITKKSTTLTTYSCSMSPCAVYCISYGNMTNEKTVGNKCVVSLNVPPPIWTKDKGTKIRGSRITDLPITGGCPSGMAGSLNAIWAALIQSCAKGNVSNSQLTLYTKDAVLQGKFPGADIAARCFSGANSR